MTNNEQSPRGKFEEIRSEPSPTMESWKPVDLAAMVKKYGLEPPAADSMFRRDGHALGYKSMVNVIFGQPEAGKSYIVLGTNVAPLIKNAARLGLGKVIVWIDYEDTWQVFLARLVKDLGVPLADVAAHLHYIKPEGGLTKEELKEVLDGVVTEETELLVIDSVNESMVSLGLDPIGMKDATTWRQQVLKPIQTLSDTMAIWVIDHEPIATTKERRHAFGSQGKLAGVQGTQLRAIALTPPMPGEEGSVALYVTKDRNGDVRSHSRTSGSQVQLAGTAFFNPAPARGARGLDISLIEPQGMGLDDEELSSVIELIMSGVDDKGVTRNQMRELVKSRGIKRGHERVDDAFTEFVAANQDRFVGRTKGNGTAYFPVEEGTE